MSTIAQGARRRVQYIEEDEWGTREVTPVMTVIRNTGGAGIQVARDSRQSAEFRSDRAISDVRLGVQKPTLSLPFELSWGTYDDFLESALFGDWDTADILKRGTAIHAFDIEEGFTDIDVYLTMLGAMVDRFTLSLKPEGDMITGAFDFVGSQMVDPEESSGDADATAANTNPVFDSFTGYLKKDGPAWGVATSLDLQIANNLKANYALFSNETLGIGAGRAVITGSITAFFTEKTQIDEFLAEDECALEFQLEDQLGNTYTINLPRVVWTGNSRNVAENEITQSIPFQALYDETAETEIYITRAEVST